MAQAQRVRTPRLDIPIIEDADKFNNILLEAHGTQWWKLFIEAVCVRRDQELAKLVTNRFSEGDNAERTGGRIESFMWILALQQQGFNLQAQKEERHGE